MRKNRLGLIALTFLAGTAFGISLLAVYSFVNPPKPQAISPILPGDARILVTNYKNTPKGIPYAFKVDENMFSAMTTIKDQFTDVKEFRIYLGIENKNDTVGIVVGLNNLGKDASGKVILKTVSQHSGLCPTLCDSESPINPK